MVDGDSRQRKGKNAGRPAAERAPVSRYASSTDGGGNGNGMQELLAGEVPDLVLSILAAVNCCTPLWEQDIWWQIRVGDELLERGHFPVREEWSYTSGHREFHNHWWIATALFSLVYRCAGVPGLVCLRGAMVAVFMRLLLAVFPRTFVRWPLAALCFKILRHRLQLRPETMCVSLFLVLFLVRRRPAFGGLDGANPANPDASLLERIFLPEVMCIWFIVVLVANTHVGMVPFSGLTALILLMDGFIKHPKGKWRSAGIDPVPILRALPLAVVPFINPQPTAAITYILHHAPGNYKSSGQLLNPEMQSFPDEFLAWWNGKPTADDHPGPLLLAFVVLTAGAFLYFIARPYGTRPSGMQSAILSLPALAVYLTLTADRCRNLLWTVCFVAAMLGKSHGEVEFVRAKRSLRHRTYASLAFGVALAIFAYQWKSPNLTMALHNWPDRTAAWVTKMSAEGHVLPNVYHTSTHGGYLLYHLPHKFKLFSDPREYCFSHLDELYGAAYMNPLVLNKEILDKYGVQTFVAKIGEAMKLPDGSWMDSATRFLDKKVWARVFFDHVSEVQVRRTPLNAKWLKKHEIHELNPAYPPDYWVRVLLLVQEGEPKQLAKELKKCLKREEHYCKLIDVLHRSVDLQGEAARPGFQMLDDLDPKQLKDQRLMVRQYTESTRRLLKERLPRKQA